MNVYKEQRKKLNLTQAELAQRLFIDQTTVSKWELGKAIPDQKMLPKLATLFNVSVDYLLGRENHTTIDTIFILFPFWEVSLRAFLLKRRKI